MPGRSIRRRLLPAAFTVPSIVLSMVVLLITALAPTTASASAAATRPHSQPAAAHDDGGAILIEVDGWCDAGPTLTSPPNPVGYAPPISAGTVVDPLDLYRLQSWGGQTNRVVADHAWASTDPDRGPPAAV